jgi:hypothetical protein
MTDRDEVADLADRLRAKQQRARTWISSSRSTLRRSPRPSRTRSWRC